MYTDEGRGFPLGNLLAKLFLVIIFVLLLVWLLPKFMVPAITKSINDNCNGSDSTAIKALTSQIFADNLERMKDAAISYYTDERLPKNTGDSSKMTLSDMIGKKLIIPLIDKNNKAVDVEKSYVKITKTYEDYILKVNIKDSEKEDYILVHLGCYNYCNTYICEKKTQNGVVKGSKGDNSSNNSNKTTTTYICVKKNGKYYNNAGKVVSYEEYKKSCLKEEKHICVKYDNKYYDKNGNVVDYDNYKKSCLPEEKHYCAKYDNKYYDKNGNVVDYDNYKKSCLPEEKHICVKYDNKYYDINGNVVSYDDYKKSCETKKEYIFEYTKTTPAKFSDWSKWTSWSKTNCATKEINCSDLDTTCLKKLQTYTRKEKIGTYQKEYATQREVVKQTGSYQEKSCSKYNYVVINSTTYVTTTTTKYTQTNVINSNTQASSNGWDYVGRKAYSTRPADTKTTHYKFAGADYSYCTDTCTTLPTFYYDVYKYTGGLTAVPNTKTTPTTTTSYEASCGEYVTKTIPIYSTITVTEVATREEPLYADICYQSTKTRTLITDKKTLLKWSKYNDTTLLNDGWTYTGNRKEK